MEQSNQQRQKQTQNLISPWTIWCWSPQLLTLATETWGMGDLQEASSDLQSRAALVAPPSLPAAASHGTGDKGGQGRAAGLRCSRMLLSWLGPHRGSPGLWRWAASRGGGRARPILVISEISSFLTCEIDESSRNTSLSNWERSSSLKITLHHERAFQVPGTRTAEKCCCKANSLCKSICSNVCMSSCMLVFLAFILRWSFPKKKTFLSLNHNNACFKYWQAF